MQYESRVSPSKTEKDFWEDFFKYGLNAFNKRKKDWIIDFVSNDNFRDMVSVVLQLKAMHKDQGKSIKENEIRVQIRNNNK